MCDAHNPENTTNYIHSVIHSFIIHIIKNNFRDVSLSGLIILCCLGKSLGLANSLSSCKDVCVMLGVCLYGQGGVFTFTVYLVVSPPGHLTRWDQEPAPSHFHD